MHILYLYQYFGTPKGSWSTRVYELTRRWVAEGHRVTVVTSPYDKSDIRGKGIVFSTRIEGVDVKVINLLQSNKHSFLRRIATFIAFSFFSVYYAITVPAKVVIASSGPITIGIPGLLAKWIRNRKLVFEVRDLWPEGAIELGILKNGILKKISWWFEGLLYKQSAMVIACSRGMETSISKRYPFVNTSIIPNASDVDLFRDEELTGAFILPKWAQSKLIYLYAGSLGAMDQIGLILEVAQRPTILEKDIVFVIIGDGKNKKELVEKANLLELANVFFLDLLPKETIVGWMSYARAVLVLFQNIPVIHTSSPNKLFDAFAAQKPIIQNTTGWIYELVDETKCGINIEPHNANDFAAAIVKLENQETVDLMSRNSSKLATEQFSRDTLAKKYLALLTNLC